MRKPLQLLIILALHWAAARGHEAIIEELVRCGANPTITTNNGKTPAELSRFRKVRWVTHFVHIVADIFIIIFRLKLLCEARKWKDRMEKIEKDRFLIGDDYIFELDATSKNEGIQLPGHDDLDIDQTIILKKYLQNFSNHNLSLQELLEQYYLLPCYLKNKL